ncbi:MAG: YcaO-like family protein [Candidatus Roizmanbacteria bacterium]|nr:YcaO-like family protein [Candidatus Roizmanbacteria bacterium]
MRQNASLNEFFRKLEHVPIIESIAKYSGEYFDEPRLFHFVAETSTERLSQTYKDYRYPKNPLFGIGVSLSNPERAIYTALSESFERFSLSAIPTQKIFFSTYTDLKKNKINAVDPVCFNPKDKLRNSVIGWIKGYQLLPTRSIEKYIPAQLGYLDHYFSFLALKHKKAEQRIRPNTSNGAASHTSLESALINGIFEVIERDTVLSLYLKKVPVHPIVSSTIPFTSVGSIIQKCRDYKLEPYLFITVTDIGIPVSFCILTDRSEIGPAITIGSKCTFNLEEGLLGSIQEALISRRIARKEGELPNKPRRNKTKKAILTTIDRQLYWASLDKISLLDFMITQTPVQFQTVAEHASNRRCSLKTIIKQLCAKNFDIFYINVTHPAIKKLGFSVVKVLIPALQPHHINENDVFYQKNRLVQIAKFYGIKNVGINLIPHPIP